MRWIVCLILLLGGCSAHSVRCDAHLQPINPPAPRAAASVSTAAARAQAQALSRTPPPPPSRRTP